MRRLNVLIGANGAGKSNFVSFFRLLRELIDQRLEKAIRVEGGADACLHFGPKVTARFAAKMRFGSNAYEFALVPTVDNRFVFDEEAAVYIPQPGTTNRQLFGTGHSEARLKDHRNDPSRTWEGYKGVPAHVFEAISSWIVYHFHDTSPTAGVRRQNAINDNEALHADAGNLAAFLYRIRHENPKSYARIRDAVRVAAPFFEDFKLRLVVDQPGLIQLEWLQKDSDYPFLPHQLSDGTLRFICLATALLQPVRPPTMLFDEPELGLHPYDLTVLGDLFRTNRSQVIISTQSALLLNEFAPKDVIVVDRENGESTFRRLDAEPFAEWLQEYTLGELWQKNLLGGRPREDGVPQLVPDGIESGS